MHANYQKKYDNKDVWPNHYFLPRDFEIVQPLYDLAYLLQIIPLSRDEQSSKYRTFSLSKAAHSLDSYSTTIAQSLNGFLHFTDLDFFLSSKIKGYLSTILKYGAIDELHSYLNEREKSCLRLRSIKGLGIKIISDILNEFPNISSSSLIIASRNTGLSEDQILAILHGEAYGIWQTAHVIPPLIRLLEALERAIGTPLKYSSLDLIDGIKPIEKPFQINFSTSGSQFDDIVISKSINEDPFFSVETRSHDTWRINHVMGWYFELTNGDNEGCSLSLSELARRYDCLLSEVPQQLLSDLHMHTYWSDGLATPSNMAAAAVQNGLKYIAITDHSQSAKLQGGLNPAAWLKQSIALNNSDMACPYLHGLEVDILKDGTLDTPRCFLNGLDFVIGSFHSGLKQNRQSNTNRLIKAIESGQIDVIGHPTTKLVGRPGEPNFFRPPIDAEWDAIFEKCAEWQVALEINCFPSRLDIGGDLLKRAVQAGCWLSIGTDAHARPHIESIKFGGALVAEHKGARVLNSLTYTELISWVKSARQKRGKVVASLTGQHQLRIFNSSFSPNSGRQKINASVSSKRQIPSGSIVVGFDLTASKNKKTGVAKLSGRYVETISLATDEELLNYIKDTRPKVVSIDSPLGLPGGGEQINKDAGIVRVAEYDLASVGIPAYPALIDSMKKLTLRGINLRKAIESFSEPPTVIESYPGAAQDILAIPRKQKGLALLRAGLRTLGLKGPGLDTESHDEMDAITSALVGRYFESGDYEAMGIPAEAQLIVPRAQVLDFDRIPIIAVTGKTGAGKSVVSRYLALNYGFRWIKTRDIIGRLIADDFDSVASGRLGYKSNDKVTENHLREFGKIILEEYDQVPVREQLAQMVLQSQEPIVIDSIRSQDDISRCESDRNAILIWYVDCPENLIEKRWQSRRIKNQIDRKSYGAIDSMLSAAYNRAANILDNSESFEKLHTIIDDNLFGFLSLG